MQPWTVQVEVAIPAGAALGFFLLAVIGPVTAVDRLPMPPLASLERGAYRTVDPRSGKELGGAEWILEHDVQQGRPVVNLQEHGRDAGGHGPSHWSDRITLDLWGPHPTLTSDREDHDAFGNPVKHEEREFNYDLGSGQIVTTDVRTGATRSQAVHLTGETITPELLPVLLRLLPQATQMRFELVTREGRKVGLLAKLVGREEVQVPAGRFACFKVELDPTGLARLFAPKLFMWLTVDAPHFWVKYEGPEGFGSRRIVRELTWFETAAAAPAPAPAPPRG